MRSHGTSAATPGCDLFNLALNSENSSPCSPRRLTVRVAGKTRVWFQRYKLACQILRTSDLRLRSEYLSILTSRTWDCKLLILVCRTCRKFSYLHRKFVRVENVLFEKRDTLSRTLIWVLIKEVKSLQGIDMLRKGKVVWLWKEI